jgi:hypothetical protein
MVCRFGEIAVGTGPDSVCLPAVRAMSAKLDKMPRGEARVQRHGYAGCEPDTPEDELYGWPLLELNERRAGRALLEIAIEEGEHDPDGEGVQEGPEGIGAMMIYRLLTKPSPDSDLEKALAYAGLTRESQTVDDDRLRRLAAELREAAGQPDEHGCGQGEPDPEVADEIEGAVGDQEMEP